jgi:hypothetical protein
MGDSKIIEGISFEPVDNSKFKCSVCSKLIVNVLLKAHANSHGNAISQLKPPDPKAPEILEDVLKAKAVKKVSLQFIDNNEIPAANKETIGKALKSLEIKNPVQPQGNFNKVPVEAEEKKMAAGNGVKADGAKERVVSFDKILNGCFDEKIVIPAKNGRKSDDISRIKKKIKLSNLAIFLKIARECEVKLERVSGIFKRFKILRYLRGVKMWKKFVNRLR